jgi:glyoxylase-like metal-dependent hydrolase (beta-lactamase superfamily II)
MLRNVASVLICLTAAVANAGAPLQNTQAPGYYRMEIGAFEITALSDGTSPLPFPAKQLLVNVTPDKVAATLKASFLEDPVETSINGFLVNTGTRLILIDTGAGPLLGPRHGKLLGNLTAAGYAPEQVDEVYLTHMHGDHVGGLVVDGARVYPNATVRAARQEAEFWLSEKQMAAAPPPVRMHFQAAMAGIGPYTKAGKFKPFDGETALIPGVTARPAPGHTLGHTIYVVESNGQQLLVVGDLVHLAAVQFSNPLATVQFDMDQALAASIRKTIFADASDHRYWLAGAHIAFPGIGHVRVDGTGYTFVLTNYSAAP